MSLRNMLSKKKPDIRHYSLCDSIYVKFKKKEPLVYTDRNQQVVDGDRKGLDWKQTRMNLLRS